MKAICKSITSEELTSMVDTIKKASEAYEQLANGAKGVCDATFSYLDSRKDALGGDVIRLRGELIRREENPSHIFTVIVEDSGCLYKTRSFTSRYEALEFYMRQCENIVKTQSTKRTYRGPLPSDKYHITVFENAQIKFYVSELEHNQES